MGAVLLCTAIGAKAQVLTVNMSTGIDDATTNIIAVNSYDDTWTVKNPGGSTYNSVKCSTGAPSGYSPYSGIDPSVRMLSSYLTPAGDLSNSAPGGDYTYKMTFYYGGCATTSASIFLNFVGGDNTVTSLSLNGNSAHMLGYGFGTGYWGTNVSIPLSTSEIIAGTNTILVTVYNAGTSYTGFIMRGALTVNYTLATLTPSFTANSSYCSGSTISLDATASSGSIADHVWTVMECDQYGNPNPSATEWWSPFISGAPGYYNIPDAASGGPTMTCGKYYRIKLALQSACNPWAETSHLVYITCSPAVSTRPSTATICNGDQASLIANITNQVSGHSYTETWSYLSGYFHGFPIFTTVYSGPPAGVLVSPTTTTTYICVVTDNTTGCSTTVTWTVTVVNNDPTFSLSVNTGTSSYFTIVATANDLTASSISGFMYSLVIEELNTSTSASYYTNSGTDAWWDFPSHQFRGYVSTGTGTYTQTPWWTSPTPAVGQFLYNHTYRITRGTWNDFCSYKQFSMTITPTKGLNGQTTMVIAEDDNAPDFSYMAQNQQQGGITADTELSIYPNPSNGVFTIELSKDTKTSIEVYDVLGKMVKSYEQNGLKSTLDLSGYPKGIYMVKMISDGKLSSKKIILE